MASLAVPADEDFHGVRNCSAASRFSPHKGQGVGVVFFAGGVAPSSGGGGCPRLFECCQLVGERTHQAACELERGRQAREYLFRLDLLKNSWRAVENCSGVLGFVPVNRHCRGETRLLGKNSLNASLLREKVQGSFSPQRLHFVKSPLRSR